MLLNYNLPWMISLICGLFDKGLILSVSGDALAFKIHLYHNPSARISMLPAKSPNPGMYIPIETYRDVLGSK